VDSVRFDRKQDLEAYLLNSPLRAERLRREEALCEPLRRLERFELDGMCAACRRPTRLLVDRRYGARQTADGWIPNWRERLVCRHCGLNNRQRAMAHALSDAVAARASGPQPPTLYAMEQASPLFAWLRANLPADCTGSEYLDRRVSPFDRIWSRLRHTGHRLRHEDAEALSFDDEQFDFVVSNDVLEHVNEPVAALAEMYRVLKPGGELFLSLPFRHDCEHSVRRATLSAAGLRHFLPAQFHGNPMSRSASLVFHDFGWDFLDWLRSAGFGDVGLRLYWSDTQGYLGDPQYYFHASRPGMGPSRRSGQPG
jgi:SAM-dependent methyltransferase